MIIQIPAEISEMLLVARMEEFPASMFAVEKLTHWLWNQVVADGGDDAETSEIAATICIELGISYLELLDLGRSTRSAEMDRCISSASPPSRDYQLLLRVCALVFSGYFCSTTEVSVECEWSDCSYFSRTEDLVVLPEERAGYFYLHEGIPYPLLEMVFSHIDLQEYTNPFIKVSSDAKKYFDEHREEFCFLRSDLDRIDSELNTCGIV